MKLTICMGVVHMYVLNLFEDSAVHCLCTTQDDTLNFAVQSGMTIKASHLFWRLMTSAAAQSLVASARRWHVHGSRWTFWQDNDAWEFPNQSWNGWNSSTLMFCISVTSNPYARLKKLSVSRLVRHHRKRLNEVFRSLFSPGRLHQILNYKAIIVMHFCAYCIC